MTFFKYCRKCGDRFSPLSKYSKLCDPCRKEVKNVNFIKMICQRNNMDINKIKKGL